MVEIPKSYEPQAVEEKWYAQWLADGCFHADPASSKPGYSIVIPPPNVTGVLTLGHVLNNTIQDILARRARMLGHEVLWLPGTDHAGLATQTAVEKALRKPADLPPRVRETLESLEDVWDREAAKPRVPLTRHHIPREAMLKLVWAWTKDRGGVIIQQLKKLGCSCDWERERFTMDEGYSQAVLEAFVALYHKGYIYRGSRMVNWCPASLTAISDEEVVPTPQKSKLYTIRYEVVEEPGMFLEIATTRPETLMGDTAVAVSPKDPRYQRFIGKHCWRPFPRAAIPIIADEHIDPEFGTGVLKVTPAHDRADFEIGQRHNLPIIDVLHPDGRINCPDVPELDGIDRFEARKKSVEMLVAMEGLVKEEPYENNVGFSERGQVPIEPRLSEQWFLDYQKMLGGTMIDASLRIVREKTVRFFPERWEKVYNHWLENIQDWCLSRQVIWGHRIPVWYGHGEVRCQVDSPGEGWEQDADSLDTWASSWLWAYATMDAPTRRKFYPTAALVTGPDIIFLWVARMIIAGLEFNPAESPHDPASPEYLTANRAFQDVFFTGIIRDKQGRKMSKSLGNSPDPLDLIAKFGADGLRFGLMRIAPQGQDIKFDEQQVVEGRNFCNKLWNACRFRTMQGPIDPLADPSKHQLSIFASDLLAKLDVAITRIEEGYRAYRFNDVAQALYDFVWGEFCDKFIETAKSDFNSDDAARKAATLATIDYTLSRVLRLLHPYAPFLTEELWHGLGFGTTTIQLESWPERSGIVGSTNADAIHTAVSQARNLRSTYNIPSNRKLAWALRPADAGITSELPVLKVLLNAEPLDVCATAPAGAAVCVTPIGEIYLPLEGIIDADAEKKRLDAEIKKVAGEIQKVQAKLASETFVQNAPAAVVEEHRERQRTWEERLDALQRASTALG
jgi:valyl-tRNA synthetase